MDVGIARNPFAVEGVIRRFPSGGAPSFHEISAAITVFLAILAASRLVLPARNPSTMFLQLAISLSRFRKFSSRVF